jgi:hypothetical protein
VGGGSGKQRSKEIRHARARRSDHPLDAAIAVRDTIAVAEAQETAKTADAKADMLAADSHQLDKRTQRVEDGQAVIIELVKKIEARQERMDGKLDRALRKE